MANKDKSTKKKEKTNHEQQKQNREQQLKTQIQMLNFKQDENMTRVYTAFFSFK